MDGVAGSIDSSPAMTRVATSWRLTAAESLGSPPARVPRRIVNEYKAREKDADVAIVPIPWYTMSEQ